MSKYVKYDRDNGIVYFFDNKNSIIGEFSRDDYVKFLEHVGNNYFNRRFSFDFVSNLSLEKCIEKGNNLINREIDSYINLTLEDSLEVLGNTMAIEFNIWWKEEGNKKITSLHLIDCCHLIGLECENEEFAKIYFTFSEGVKDIADRCVKKAKEFVDNKIKKLEKENMRKVLTGDLS